MSYLITQLSTSKQRLDTLDGLRAIAAIGVLWIHTWTVHGNPRLFLAGVDITSLLALGGNGVDLFFVISGFCMYYFYANKPSFTYRDFWVFIKKRWLRLSPAFYVATVAYVLINNNGDTDTIIPKILTSFFYLNSLSPYNAEGFFWSLSPEWQFYILIPFLLIYQIKAGFRKTFCIISLLMLVLAVLSVMIFQNRSDIFTSQIIFRFFEFGCGIIVARIMLIYPLTLKLRWAWLLLFIFLSYSGRILLSNPILSLSQLYYNLFKLLGFTIMAIGFGGIMYLALTSEKWLKKTIGNRIISSIGRVSYSFYLWHGLVHIFISQLVIANFGTSTIVSALITFTLSLIILIPISFSSYSILERPLFPNKRH